MQRIERRTFLQSAAMLSAMAAIGNRSSAAAAGSPKKAVLISMTPKGLSYLDRFKLAQEVGFEGIEANTAEDPKVADEIREASAKTGLRIHSVMNMAHWQFPLSSSKPEDVNKSVAGMESSGAPTQSCWYQELSMPRQAIRTRTPDPRR